MARLRNDVRSGLGLLADRRARARPRSLAAGRLLGAALLATALLAGCQTSALGRRQLKLYSDAEMSQMGVAMFADIAKQTPPSKDALANAKVTCVANVITRNLNAVNAPNTWEVRVFADDTANAFALPGGKIGVNTGLLKVARTQGQLAAVIGHEVTHVTEGHANERVSTEVAANSALQVLAIAANASGPGYGQLVGALGVGVQYGVLMPFGREQETEADLEGMDLMAKAGFDPREAIDLWKNMEASGGSQPPEFISTHPSYGNRMRHLQERLPIAMPLYEDAKAKGRAPKCY